MRLKRAIRALPMRTLPSVRRLGPMPPMLLMWRNTGSPAFRFAAISSGPVRRRPWACQGKNDDCYRVRLRALRRGQRHDNSAFFYRYTLPVPSFCQSRPTSSMRRSTAAHPSTGKAASPTSAGRPCPMPWQSSFRSPPMIGAAERRQSSLDKGTLATPGSPTDVGQIVRAYDRRRCGTDCGLRPEGCRCRCPKRSLRFAPHGLMDQIHQPSSLGCWPRHWRRASSAANRGSHSHQRSGRHCHRHRRGQRRRRCDRNAEAFAGRSHPADLTTLRKLRFMLQALETRLEGAFQVREAG